MIRRNRRIISTLSVLPLIAVFLSLFGCYQLDNPVDPNAPAYQGYESTRITDELLNSVFVSSSAGDDVTGKGSYDSPFASIQHGLAYAAAEGYPAVRVAEGYYPVNPGMGFAEINLVEGVSLYGGYSYPDWFCAPEVFVTEVIDERAAGGTFVVPNRCFYAAAGVTRQTKIEGFRIFGSGDFSTGIYCDTDGSPTISENYIDGGIQGAATETYGIVINEAAPLVEGNTVIGGHGDITMGIDIFGLYNPVIRNNVIFGGEAVSTAYGIHAIQADNPLIEDNNIDGGSTGTTFGIWLDNSRVDIRNNHIFGGMATTGSATGIHSDFSSIPSIESNHIIGGEAPNTVYGIRCESSTSGAIRNNYIEGGIGNTAAGIHSTNSTPNIENNTILGSPEGDTIAGIFLINSSLNIIGNTIFSGIATSTGMAVQCTGGSNALVINNIISGEEAVSNSGGLMCSDSSPIVRNNLIYAGFSPTSYAVTLFSSGPISAPYMDNNIILGGPNGMGIYLSDNISDPSSIRHNDIFDCPNGVYSDPINGVFFDIPGMEGLDPANYYGNVSFEPLFADPAGGDLHLTSSSPMEVREGGLDGAVLGWPFNTDRDGEPRTGNGATGWSMGPYEYD